MMCSTFAADLTGVEVQSAAVTEIRQFDRPEEIYQYGPVTEAANVGGTTIGVFTLTRHEVNPFTEKQVELVTPADYPMKRLLN